jgi:hypothetical protein
VQYLLHKIGILNSPGIPLIHLCDHFRYFNIGYAGTHGSADSISVQISWWQEGGRERGVLMGEDKEREVERETGRRNVEGDDGRGEWRMCHCIVFKEYGILTHNREGAR